MSFEHQRTLKQIVKNNNRKSAEQITNTFNEKTGLNASTKTITRNLHDLNYFSRVPAVKPLLNDRQRKSRLDWCAEKKIKMLANWPSQSPDLNPIEHLWSELDRRIRNRSPLAKNLKELETALQEEWRKISNTVLMNLIESMPRRIEACIANNGWPTNINYL